MSQAPSPPSLRRIVTKHDKDGIAVVDTDTTVHSQNAAKWNVSLGTIWATDAVPTNDNNLNVDGATRPIHDIVSPNGTACLYTDLGPGVTVPMHRTSTVDLNVLSQNLSNTFHGGNTLIIACTVYGEVILIMENGEEYHLKNPGDTVVQKGTLHAWKNPINTWTRWVTFVIDAEPAAGVDGQPLPNVS